MTPIKIKTAIGLIAWSLTLGAQAYDVAINITAQVAMEGCIINNGADALVDFGAFQTHGLVQNKSPSNGDLIKHMTLPISCDLSGNPTSLEFTFNGASSVANPDTIATSTPELGIAIADSSEALTNDNWIVPNTGMGQVLLDATGLGTISVYAAPIALAPSVPAGPFTAQAILNVIYP